jgi:hypothetical protein
MAKILDAKGQNCMKVPERYLFALRQRIEWQMFPEVPQPESRSGIGREAQPLASSA